MSTTPDITADRTTPQVLLFGHPGSGKSSLLGALLQASDTQPTVLGDEVVDPSRRLQLIRDHVYTGAHFQNTRTELVAYRIELHTPEFAVPPHPPRPVVLLDCDGGAASNLLRHLEPLNELRVTGHVAAAVVRSDAIALVVDATAKGKELQTRFEEFQLFLQEVHGRKTFYREVGGFPIFLVLAKCDELAKEGDTRAAWEARVAERLEDVLERFEDFLEDEDRARGIQSPYLPFGSVRVRGHSVAVRRPETDDEPHPPDEPFGVADLFHDCFAAARDHRGRVLASERRLKWTVVSMLLAVWVLIAGVIGVVVFQPPPADPGLADRVKLFWDQDPPAAVRLAEKNIARNKKALAQFKADPGFFALPEDLRGFVSGHLQEIEDYQAYKARLATAPVPADARTLEELARVESVLDTEFALPPEYSWGETEAAQLRDKWLADVRALRQAEAGWSEWYRSLGSRAVALTYARSFDAGWRAEVAAVLADGNRLPFNPSDVIPGSEAVPDPRGEPLTYRVASEFDRVYQARRDWEFNRARLVHLRDLADAVGLTPQAEAPRALVIPEPGPAIDSATLPGMRLNELRVHYPRPSAEYPALDGEDAAGPRYPEWELRNFPDPVRGLLAGRLRESIRNGVRHAHALILARLGTPPADTPEGWQRVAAALDEPAFRDWGRLLGLMLRLEDPSAANPVADLAAFLGPSVKDRTFPLDLRGLDLAIPLELRVPRLDPAGALTLTLTPKGGGPPTVRTFRPSGDGTQQGLVMKYTFRPEGDGRLTYRPGDELKLELPARSGAQKFTLVWAAGGTDTFQFERITREPRLAPAVGATEPATGVRLVPTGDSSVPRIPVLLPDVRR
jgi:hypothetical protein